MGGERTLGLIWAQSTAGVIGRAGGLPWHLPEDMAHFREVTAAQPVIMGRRTWESLPERFRPLPGRRTIVVSRRAGYPAPGAELAGSLAAAVALATGRDNPGGRRRSADRATRRPGSEDSQDGATRRPGGEEGATRWPGGVGGSGGPEVLAWVAGGTELYRAARELAAVAEVTEVDLEVAGDTFAPSLAGWVLAWAGDWRTSSTGLRYRFLRYTHPTG